jgi:hypothetical protein
VYRLLSLITIFYFIFYATIARGEEDTSFEMPINILCDNTEKIIKFLDDEGYEPIVRGITDTGAGEILTIIYAAKDGVVMIGVDSDGFACFIGEISDNVKWMKKIDLFNYKGPKKPA